MTNTEMNKKTNKLLENIIANLSKTFIKSQEIFDINIDSLSKDNKTNREIFKRLINDNVEKIEINFAESNKHKNNYVVYVAYYNKMVDNMIESIDLVGKLCEKFMQDNSQQVSNLAKQLEEDLKTMKNNTNDTFKEFNDFQRYLKFDDELKTLFEDLNAKRFK